MFMLKDQYMPWEFFFLIKTFCLFKEKKCTWERNSIISCPLTRHKLTLPVAVLEKPLIWRFLISSLWCMIQCLTLEGKFQLCGVFGWWWQSTPVLSLVVLKHWPNVIQGCLPERHALTTAAPRETLPLCSLFPLQGNSSRMALLII